MRARKGQALVEYVLALAALLAVVGVMWWLVDAAWARSARATALVRSEYP